MRRKVEIGKIELMTDLERAELEEYRRRFGPLTVQTKHIRKPVCTKHISGPESTKEREAKSWQVQEN